MSKDPKTTQSDCCGVDSERGPNYNRVPNVVVHTHDGQRAVFYRDLVQGKIVLINLMSISHDEAYPVTANIAKLQSVFGERLGKDIFIYSISLDPEKDSPKALKAFAERYEVKPGWKFLTGEVDTIADLVTRLFGHAHCHPGGADGVHLNAAERAAAKDCSLGVIRYGNESLGIWAAVPAKADPLWIAERISWVTPREAVPAKRAARRAGPAPLTQQHPVTARILGS